MLLYGLATMSIHASVTLFVGQEAFAKLSLY
jgi:hypothetical protein